MLTLMPNFKDREQVETFLATRMQRVRSLVMMLLGGDGTHVLPLSAAIKVLRHFLPNAAEKSADELQAAVNLTLAEVVPEEAHKLVYIEGAACVPVEKSNRHASTVALDLDEAIAMVRCMLKERASLLEI